MWGDRPLIEWNAKTVEADLIREELPQLIRRQLKSALMPLTENRTLRKIGPIDPNKTDDLYIGTVSFERRCCACTSRLSESYHVEHALIIRFKKTEQGLRERHYESMNNDLAWRTSSRRIPEVLWCERDDPIDGQFKLVSFLGTLKQPIERITLDITTLTKPSLGVAQGWYGTGPLALNRGQKRTAIPEETVEDFREPPGEVRRCREAGRVTRTLIVALLLRLSSRC